MANNDFCIIYVATGKSYVDEAFVSAVSSLPHASNVPIYLFTDLVEYAHSINHDGVFSRIITHPDPVYSYRDKILPLLSLPAENCLFLDTDAFLVSSIDDLFDLVKYFDIAACYSPVRHPPGWTDSSVPLCFSEINTGVIFLRRSSVVSSLIEAWFAKYTYLEKLFSQAWDQASFRSVLWHFISCNKLCFHILPGECNIRTTKPWILGRGLRPFVIHGRFPSEELVPFLNYINGDIDTFRTSCIWTQLHSNTSIRPRFDRTYS